MAFQKDKTTAAQTATNVAGGIVSALVAAGHVESAKEAASAVETIFVAVFGEDTTLAAVVEADNLNFIAQDGGGSEKPARKSSGGSSSRSSGTKSRAKTGGGSRGRGKGGSSITLEDALDMELNFGAFEGEKLGALLDFDTNTCDSDYGYGDGERDGTDYISWLASDSNQNEYVQRRARLIADDAGIDY